jgi:predicted Zn-dependent protease
MPHHHAHPDAPLTGTSRPPLAPQSAPGARPRFWSEADCHDLLARLARVAEGGGTTNVLLWSSWTGSVRWARNQISSASEVRNNHIRVGRNLNGAQNAWLLVNDDTDTALVQAAREAERLARLVPESPQGALYARFVEEPTPPTAPLFFETTYAVDADRRAAAAEQLMQAAGQAGMLSAGYLAVGAHSMAVLDTDGHARYCQYTTAQYSVTVRDPKGIGSGWAGVDWPDWSKIDGAKLSALALDKCLQSRNPVAVEPGRYTTILEPQAVGDLLIPMMQSEALLQYDKSSGSLPTQGSFSDSPPTYQAKKWQRVIDARLTLVTDPADPDLAFPPFNPMVAVDGQSWGLNLAYDVYHPATWIEQGVLKALAYDRNFALDQLGENLGLPNSGAVRMSVTGPTTSLEEMIATTTRGLLVTRFDGVQLLAEQSQLCRGYTRDGVWLIERGKISKAVKNLVFTESVLFALNNVEQVGIPQRVFHPKADSIRTIPQPVIVPALKVKDFSFTALTSAI